MGVIFRLTANILRVNDCLFVFMNKFNVKKYDIIKTFSNELHILRKSWAIRNHLENILYLTYYSTNNIQIFVKQLFKKKKQTKHSYHLDRKKDLNLKTWLCHITLLFFIKCNVYIEIDPPPLKYLCSVCMIFICLLVWLKWIKWTWTCFCNNIYFFEN